MNLPPPIPNTSLQRATRKAPVVWTSLIGLCCGGLLGYWLAWDWAVRATSSDPEWDGGISVLIVYGIIAIATCVAALIGGFAAGFSAWLILRRRVVAAV